MDHAVIVITGIMIVLLISGCLSSDYAGPADSFNTDKPSCTPDWGCDEWGECTGTWENATQARNCIDNNNCGTTREKPPEFQSCEIPRTTIKEPSELALQQSDLPEGFEIQERGERLRSDVSEWGLNTGWKKGYYVKFVKRDDDNVFAFTEISQSISFYPIENISITVEHEYNWTEWLGENITIERLSDPDIGENSRAIRFRTSDDGYQGTLYWIEFSKYDVYSLVRLWGTTGIDYELLKELAGIIERKIV